MRQALLTTLIFATVLTGCPDPEPATEVLVIFEADRGVQRVARDIKIVVYGGVRGDSIPDDDRQELSFNIADIDGWPVSHTLVPIDNDWTRLYRVEGLLYDGNSTEPIATVRAISGYVEGRSLVLRLRFYAQCLYVEPCEDPDFSCNGVGDCQPSRSNPVGLPENLDGGVADTGPEPFCRTDLDCDDGVSCTDDICLRGECINQARDDRCTEFASGSCDRLNGCQYGGGCDVTTNCQTTDCEFRTCEDDVCVRLSRCPLGATCCGGVCGTCNDGDPCTSDSCDDAAATCVNEGGAGAACDDGTYCTGTGTCGADGACELSGNPCDSSTTCDEESAACVGCLTSADCPGMMTMVVGTCETPPAATPSEICMGVAQTDVIITTYTCNVGVCEASEMSGTMGCDPGPTDGRPCDTDMTSWSGRCDPTGSVCVADGIEFGTTTLSRCMGNVCRSTDSSTTSRACPWTPPASCREPAVDSGAPDTSRRDSSFDSGVDTGFDSGMDSGFDSGFDSGTDSGFDSGTFDSGFDSGTDSGFDSGTFDSGFDSGTDSDTGGSTDDTGPPGPDTGTMT